MEPPLPSNKQMATSLNLPQVTLQQGTEPPKYEEAIGTEATCMQGVGKWYTHKHLSIWWLSKLEMANSI